MSKFIIYKGSDSGEQAWRWRLKDSNGVKIAKSEEPFIKDSVKRSIKTLQQKITSDTPVYLDESKEDIDKGNRFEYFQSEKDEQWYWRFKAGNNELMAIGGEGFVSEQSILKSIANVKVEIPAAEILFEDPKDDPAHDAKDKDTTKENPNIPPGSIADELQKALKEQAIDYLVVPSDVSPCSGITIAIKNYYPSDKDDNISLSIALSYSPDSWTQKCWLSVKIPANDPNEPLYCSEYKEFDYKGIHYYPYSIQTKTYQLVNVIGLCDGLYRYVKNNIKNE